MRRLVGEGALRVGRSFVEKRGKAGRNGGCSIEESGGSIGEIEQRCAVVGAEGCSDGEARTWVGR